MGDHPADPWMFKAVAAYGLKVLDLGRKQGYAVLRSLQRGDAVADVAKQHNVGVWEPVGPSPKQLNLLAWKVGEEFVAKAKTPRQCSLLLDAFFNPLKLYKRLIREIDKAGTASELDAVGRDIRLVTGVLPEQHMAALIEAGKEKRLVVGKGGEIPE